MAADANQEPTDNPKARPQPERRWYQFGVGTKLVGVGVVVAFVLGLLVNHVILRPYRQFAETRMVRQLGGYPFFDQQGKISGVMFRHPVTDAELEPLKIFPALQKLLLSGTQATDATLAHVKQFKALRRLGLNDTQVTDTGLAHLAGLRALTSLELDNTQVTDAGLAHLEGLDSLKELSLTGTKVTKDGIATLKAALPKCEILCGVNRY
ncbi:MAG: hypothetical protein AB7O62_10700 [Pirellulales bacterium]